VADVLLVFRDPYEERRVDSQVLCNGYRKLLHISTPTHNGGEVDDQVPRALIRPKKVSAIIVNEKDVFVGPSIWVLGALRYERVDARHKIPAVRQVITKVTTDETCTARNKHTHYTIIDSLFYLKVQV
jgi:hypothetical protein